MVKQRVGEWVAAACGCIWRESRPSGMLIDPDAPRACGTHYADHPASVRPSPQGMAMVPVTYHETQDDVFRCSCDPADLFDPPDPRPRAVQGCAAHRARRAAQLFIERDGLPEGEPGSPSNNPRQQGHQHAAYPLARTVHRLRGR